MNANEWIKIASMLDVGWPNAKLSEDTIALWGRLLADLDAQAVARAVVALRNEPGREFVPGPGDIREAVDGRSATDAEAELRAAIHAGVKTTKELSDPYARQAVKALGGMRAVRDRTDRWDYDFRRHYDTIRKREIRQQALAVVDRVGIGELTDGS